MPSSCEHLTQAHRKAKSLSAAYQNLLLFHAQCEWTAVAVRDQCARADARGRMDSPAAHTEADFSNGCPPPQLPARGSCGANVAETGNLHKCRRLFERGAGNARTGSRAAGTPKMQAPDCAPRPARSAIGSPSASASGRGRVGRRRAPAAARGCTARPQTRAAMAPRGADSQPAQPPAQPSGALLHRRRPRAHAAPPRLGSPLCVDPWMARDFVPVMWRPRTRLG